MWNVLGAYKRLSQAIPSGTTGTSGTSGTSGTRNELSMAIYLTFASQDPSSHVVTPGLKSRRHTNHRGLKPRPTREHQVSVTTQGPAVGVARRAKKRNPAGGNKRFERDVRRHVWFPSRVGLARPAQDETRRARRRDFEGQLRSRTLRRHADGMRASPPAGAE